MEIQPTRHLSASLKFDPSSLKEVSQSQKKRLYELSDSRSAIIIDYGSQTIKAGYADGQNQPEMVFRPYASKNRDPNKAEAPVKQAINTSYEQLDFQKISYKSAYERNIILHFSILEQCNDYIFAQMIRPNKQIRSPVIISQPFANPIHCRSSVLEQFFECYQVDSVMVGIDSLFAYFYELGCNLHKYETQTALVVDIGGTATHLFAFVDGKMQWQSVQRINVGGANAFELFGKTVLLKNPQLKTRLTYSYLHDLYQKFTEVAIDYKEQLNFFKRTFEEQKCQSTIYKNRIHEANKYYEENLKFTMPIEIDFETFIEVPEQEIRRKQEVKQRMSEKLKETINRRKEMKRRVHQKQLKDLQYLKEKYDEHDPSAHQEVAQQFGDHKAYEKLLKKIKEISMKLGLIEQKPEDLKKFSLIDIPDSELPPEKLKFKKMQMYQKKAMQERQQRIKAKEEQERQMKDLRQNNPEEYLAQLRAKYQTLSKRVKENERIKNELNNRKSKLKQKKMQLLVRLAEDQLDDNFGQNDDDWLIYKEVEDSDHFSEIEAMEAELRDIDPDWVQNKKDIHHLNCSNQLFLTSQLVRCNEIFFQPKLIGVNQKGIIDEIVLITRQFSPEVQQKLLQNVCVIGGGAQIRGLKERITRDLRRECPIELKIGVSVSQVGWKGAFLGMQNIARMQPEFIPKMSNHRHNYEQDLRVQKVSYVQNPWSNPQPNI